VDIFISITFQIFLTKIFFDFMSNINLNVASVKPVIKNPSRRNLQFVHVGQMGVALLCITLMLYACKSDHTKLPKDNELLGKWLVFYSEMNNKPNDLMKEAHFLFLDDNKVESNLFDGQTYDYTVKDGGLNINNPDQFLLSIVYFQNDTLVLSGKLKYYNIKLKMVKANPI